MRRTNVTVVAPSRQLGDVESRLQSFGFAAAGFDRLEAGLAGARRQRSCLFFCDAALLEAARPEQQSDVRKLEQSGDCPLILLGPPQESAAALPYGFDLPALHALLSRTLGDYSRRHMRLVTNLPGVFIRSRDSHFCEIVNLSAGGAYLKTGTPLSTGDGPIRLHIPLLGTKRELEIEGRVVFEVRPTETNNFQQGAGVRFCDTDEQTVHQLDTYLADVVQQRLLEVRNQAPLHDTDAAPPGGRTPRGRGRQHLLAP